MTEDKCPFCGSNLKMVYTVVCPDGEYTCHEYVCKSQIVGSIDNPYTNQKEGCLRRQRDQLQAQLKSAEELLNAVLRGESEDQLRLAIQDYYINYYDPQSKQIVEEVMEEENKNNDEIEININSHYHQKYINYRHCPKCGGLVGDSDNYCPSCGGRIKWIE